MNVNYRITIDGVDKTGKDLLLQYVVRLSNHRFVIQARGLLSQLAYSKIYERDYSYDLTQYKNDVIFYLKGNLEDLTIRHKITNEPKIDIENDIKIFDDTAKYLRDNGIIVIELDTSEHTPYQNAKKIIETIDSLEKELENGK